MELAIEVSCIQHIERMSFSIDFEACKITCIVGRNGTGKTTLIKAIKNLSSADTFKKTSSDAIFGENSLIKYMVSGEEYCFYFDRNIRSLNCKKIVPDAIKKCIDVELPMPHGQRFNFFQSVSDADLEIRRSIILESYVVPTELISFLSDIYGNDKFKSLIQIKIKNIEYYCILLKDSKYIREDYLSSGEYFLISLYRKIKDRRKLIVIDEIDISLDAAAQAHLVRMLREFCGKYKVNVLFTTHSLAMMRTLRNDELLYMRDNLQSTEIYPASYNYIKTVLFGFLGWDKYILTEDQVLQAFLEYAIRKYCTNLFYKYKIIYIGGGSNVADLLRRNTAEKFLSEPENVIAILDGDQRSLRIARKEGTYCIPMESVEKALFQDYQRSDFSPKLDPDLHITEPKDLYKALIRGRLMTEDQIFNHLCSLYDGEMRSFSVILEGFLSRRS